MRTFLAIEVPRAQREVVYTIIKEATEKNLPVRWVNFENLHLTLKFLGEIDEKKKNEITPVITEVAKKFAPFPMSLEGIGCFPGPKNPRVLWVGVKESAEKLIEIANTLEEHLSRLGFKKEDKKFHPHLTFGRIKTFCKVDDILAETIQTEAFTVTAITLFKSTLKPEGPIYEELQKFPLSSEP